MNNTLLKVLLAELLGTFTLVFLGGLAVILVSTDPAIGAAGAGVVLPALAHGLAVIGIVYTYGAISGAHVNPAVTLGLLIGGKISLDRAAFYMVAQFIGAVIAAVVINLLSPAVPDSGATFAVAGQATGIWTTANLPAAGIIEFILTFFLVSVVYHTAVFEKTGNVAGIAIGFTLIACILAGGYFSGASLNPARTLGPALIAGVVDYVPVYLLATFGGGALAGLVHGYPLAPAVERPARVMPNPQQQ